MRSRSVMANLNWPGLISLLMLCGLMGCGGSTHPKSSLPGIIAGQNLKKHETTIWERKRENVLAWLKEENFAPSLVTKGNLAASSPSQIGRYALAFWKLDQSKIDLAQINFKQDQLLDSKLTTPETQAILTALCTGKLGTQSLDEIFLFTRSEVFEGPVPFKIGPLESAHDIVLLGCLPQGFPQDQKVILGWQIPKTKDGAIPDNHPPKLQFKFRLVLNTADAWPVNPIVAQWIDQRQDGQHDERFLYRSSYLVGEGELAAETAGRLDDSFQILAGQLSKEQNFSYRVRAEADQ